MILFYIQFIFFELCYCVTFISHLCLIISKTMSTSLETLFGGSLIDLAEKAGTRLNEAEQRIQNCDDKSEYALQNVTQLEVKIKTMIDLLDKINLRFDMFENEITTRLDKLEYNQSRKQTETKEYIKESKSVSKRDENVNKDTSKEQKEQQVRDGHVKNDLLNKKVNRDKDFERGKMKALRMLDELSVVSESR